MPRITALACLTFSSLMAWSLCGGASAAEPVWRCAAADGASVAYQATPCPDAGRALAAGTAPTPEDQKASAQVADREARLARVMGRQRAQREKLVPPAHASLSGPVRQVSVGQREEPRSKASRHGTEQSKHQARQRRHDVFRADVPGRSRQKAQADAVAVSPP